MAKTLWNINFRTLNTTNDNQFKAFGGKYTHTENLTNGVYTADGYGTEPSPSINAVDIDWNDAQWPNTTPSTPTTIKTTGDLISAIKYASTVL